MKISKRNRPLVLISLILFPMVIILCSFSLNVQAGPPIPEPDPNNGWHWDVNVGDQIYFEGEFILTNSTNGEVYAMWKDIWIYNITSIEDITTNWLGTHLFSQVNATRCYYNVTDGVNELEAYGESEELALFGHNSTDPITHRIRAGTSGVPFLLPINRTIGLDVDILAPIINETFYYPMGQVAFNKFDSYEFDNNTNWIHFENSTDHFYTDGYYFDNGTLEYGEAYLAAYMEDDPIYINATIRQVFDYIITDEVEWGVNVGDEIPFTMYMGSSDVDDADEIILNITHFDEVLFNKSKNSFSDEDNIYMVYQAVFADMFMWNGTDYNFIENTMISASNNFYPQYYDEVGGDPIMPLLWPINVPLEDYEFMWNLDTLRIWEGMRYDTINIMENGLLEFELSNSTSIDYVEIQMNKTTGITKSFLNINSEEEVMYFEVRSQTLVDWSVNVGDILYYKNNEEDLWDVQATILGTGSVYANMSEMFVPMGIALPSGQPEYQFFSYLYANISEWDSTTNSWDFDHGQPFAVANIYWPISPLQFDFGPPVLMPKGTTSSELSGLFDFYSSVFDVITYSPGHVLLRNSTLDRELNFYFDETSGRVTMMSGWMKQPTPGSDWNYMSIYPKFYKALTPGSNPFTLSTDFPSGITVSMDVDVSIGGPDAALIYNYFTMNPVNVSVPEGTPLGFFDQLLINWSLISGNITMTVTLPLSIDIDEIILFLYAFNMSGSMNWDSAPPEFYANYVTFDNLTNSMIYKMEPNMFFKGIMSAMSYEYINIPGDFTLTSTADDPDDDGDFDLTWTASSLANTYTIYQYDKFITEINGSLTILAAGVTDLTYSLSGYTNGTYYFIVVAVNSYGETLSNCIQIVVEIPPSEAGEPEIPGYNLLFLSLMLIIVSGLVIRKVRKK